MDDSSEQDKVQDESCSRLEKRFTRRRRHRAAPTKESCLVVENLTLFFITISVYVFTYLCLYEVIDILSCYVWSMI